MEIQSTNINTRYVKAIANSIAVTETDSSLIITKILYSYRTPVEDNSKITLANSPAIVVKIK